MDKQWSSKAGLHDEWLHHLGSMALWVMSPSRGVREARHGRGRVGNDLVPPSFLPDLKILLDTPLTVRDTEDREGVA